MLTKYLTKNHFILNFHHLFGQKLKKKPLKMALQFKVPKRDGVFILFTSKKLKGILRNTL